MARSSLRSKRFSSGYFLIVLLAVQDCIRRDGDARIFGVLLWAFAPPGLPGVVARLGGKAGESDGSISFIGGYHHEASFSVVLVTCFAVALRAAPELFVRLFLWSPASRASSPPTTARRSLRSHRSHSVILSSALRVPPGEASGLS